jgi:hypothetical protein
MAVRRLRRCPRGTLYHTQQAKWHAHAASWQATRLECGAKVDFLLRILVSNLDGAFLLVPVAYHCISYHADEPMHL